MAGTDSPARGWGITGLVVGLLLLGVSFMAGQDAKSPRCGGEEMSSTDYCSSSRSGPQSYAKRASNAQSVSNWMLGIGGVLAVAGAGTLIVAGLVSSRRYY